MNTTIHIRCATKIRDEIEKLKMLTISVPNKIRIESTGIVYFEYISLY